MTSVNVRTPSERLKEEFAIYPRINEEFMVDLHSFRMHAGVAFTLLSFPMVSRRWWRNFGCGTEQCANLNVFDLSRASPALIDGPIIKEAGATRQGTDGAIEGPGSHADLADFGSVIFRRECQYAPSLYVLRQYAMGYVRSPA
jgi:hypothetical protein